MNLGTWVQDMPFNFVHKIHSNVVRSMSFRQNQGNSYWSKTLLHLFKTNYC